MWTIHPSAVVRLAKLVPRGRGSEFFVHHFSHLGGAEERFTAMLPCLILGLVSREPIGAHYHRFLSVICNLTGVRCRT